MKQRGVTPFELAAAVAGVAMLTAAGAWLLSATGASRDTDRALTDGQHLLRAAQDWQKSEGARGCPTVSQLKHDGFLERDANIDDPWGGRLRIECQDGATLSVRSRGPDGKNATKDDVVLDS